MKFPEVDSLIETAIREDMPSGDITSESIIPPDAVSRAIVLAKEDGVLAGIGVARKVFQKIDPDVEFVACFRDGRDFRRRDVLARLRGRTISLLKGERTALNFLQRLSGIATTTREYVRAAEGTPARILDTRKTTPGLRSLEKYAVRMGGGVNHRLSLSDMVLIKDNHLCHLGSISRAVKRAKERVPKGIRVEVEVRSFEQAREAVESGADWIMLDNMPPGRMKEIVDWVGGRMPVEASGKMTPRKVRTIARLGVDFISVGALTHSYKSVDLSLEFLDERP